jgi:hypothetical protein
MWAAEVGFSGPDDCVPCDSAPCSAGVRARGMPARRRSSGSNTPLLWSARTAPRKHSNKQSTARDPVDEKRSLRITHPFHPLRGKTFKLIERRTTWGEDRVYFHDVSGEFRRLPTAWTSVSARGVFETISAGRSHFRVEDLLQLVALIAQEKQARQRVGPARHKAKASRK